MMTGDRRPVKVLLVAVGILALAGATAGLLGIGGALIFNPYLLQLGMDPRVCWLLASCVAPSKLNVPFGCYCCMSC